MAGSDVMVDWPVFIWNSEDERHLGSYLFNLAVFDSSYLNFRWTWNWSWDGRFLNRSFKMRSPNNMHRALRCRCQFRMRRILYAGGVPKRSGRFHLVQRGESRSFDDKIVYVACFLSLKRKLSRWSSGHGESAWWVIMLADLSSGLMTIGLTTAQCEGRCAVSSSPHAQTQAQTQTLSGLRFPSQLHFYFL